jgi:hypothetical protein
MPASHFDVKPMTGRPKFIVRHSTYTKDKFLLLADSGAEEKLLICHLSYDNELMRYNFFDHLCIDLLLSDF